MHQQINNVGLVWDVETLGALANPTGKSFLC